MLPINTLLHSAFVNLRLILCTSPGPNFGEHILTVTVEFQIGDDTLATEQIRADYLALFGTVEVEEDFGVDL